MPAFGALDGVIFSCSSTVRDMTRRILYYGTASTIALVPVLVITDHPDSSIPIVAKRATIGGGAAGTLAGLRSGTGCISPIMAKGAAFCLTANRTGFGSGAVCGGPVVLFIATFFAIGSTCCQGAAFGRTLMPVVGIIAGPLGSPLVNMGVVMVRVHGFIVRSTRPSSTSVTDRSSSFLIPTLTSPTSAASLTL